jgi:hypothetical protein
MRLGRAFEVMVATARPGFDQVPDGFTPIWGGTAAVHVRVLDRDHLGTPTNPLDLVTILVHVGPGAPPCWDSHE